MTDSFVDVRVRLDNFENLVQRVASLPAPFRPTYFTVGERVRNKAESLIEDEARFGAFFSERVKRVSGFDLVGEKIRFGFFVGETRASDSQSTHVGCSVLLKGDRWSSGDLLVLLKKLCCAVGVERAEACRRSEWEFRHKCVKQLPSFTIERTLGVDMSAALPGLYWWTAFSEELLARHRLDVGVLKTFAATSEQWSVEDGRVLHAFNLYDAPDDWLAKKDDVSRFLESRREFFSLTRVSRDIDLATNKDEFDVATRPFVAGAVAWV